MVSVPSSERRVAPFISVRHCRCSDLSRELLCDFNSYTYNAYLFALFNGAGLEKKYKPR